MAETPCEGVGTAQPTIVLGPLRKPTAALILAIIGGFVIFYCGLLLIELGEVAGSGSLGILGGNLLTRGAIETLAGILVIVFGVVLYMAPHHHVVMGTLILVCSLASLVGLGGFIIGFLLGLIGAILGIVHKPKPWGQTMFFIPPRIPAQPERLCLKCGAATSMGDRFCPFCGGELDSGGLLAPPRRGALVANRGQNGGVVTDPDSAQLGTDLSLGGRRLLAEPSVTAERRGIPPATLMVIRRQAAMLRFGSPEELPGDWVKLELEIRELLDGASQADREELASILLRLRKTLTASSDP